MERSKIMKYGAKTRCEKVAQGGWMTGWIGGTLEGEDRRWKSPMSQKAARSFYDNFSFRIESLLSSAQTNKMLLETFVTYARLKSVQVEACKHLAFKNDTSTKATSTQETF